MDVSVITVTTNSEDTIAQQVESLPRGCKNISFEQIVIDNASRDRTIELLETKFPHVRILKNAENKGFGYSNNRGVALATGRYLLFLNPDMQVSEGSLDELVEYMDKHPEIGIVGGKLVDLEGNFLTHAKPRCFPKVWEQVALIFKLPHFFPKLFTRSMFLYFHKWEAWYKWIWVALAIPFGLLIAYIQRTILQLTGKNLAVLSRLYKQK